MPTLFLVVFVNVLGFGLIVPLLPFYVERLGGGPATVTLIIALYSLLQFLTAPLIGRLSDRYGRRPLMAWTMLGTVLGHVLLGIADSLWLVIVSRAVLGVMAGNLGVAYAYASDITTHDQRPKAIGILSAGFGMGFMFGPGIGGLLAGPEVATANFFLPAFSAAGLSIIGLLCILFILPESLKPEDRADHADAPRISMFEQIRVTFKLESVAVLSIVSLLLYAAWSMLLAIFALWANRVLGHGPKEIGFVFMYMGAIGTITQLTLIGPLAKRVGEMSVILFTVLTMVIGLLMIASATDLTMTILATTVLAASHSVFTPMATSVVSKKASSKDRGTVLGIFQGFGSLGRVVGPACAGFAFSQLGYTSPYLIGAAVMVPCCLLTLVMIRGSKGQ
jgi:DHA1 family tetracycline resistance protein-like MFS transporter